MLMGRAEIKQSQGAVLGQPRDEQLDIKGRSRSRGHEKLLCDIQ